MFLIRGCTLKNHYIKMSKAKKNSTKTKIDY